MAIELATVTGDRAQPRHLHPHRRQQRGNTMTFANTKRTAAGLAITSLLLAGCGSSSSSAGGAGGSSSAAASVGVDFPRSDSEFWNAFNKYVPQKATQLGVSLLTPTNSQNDIQKLIANV